VLQGKFELRGHGSLAIFTKVNYEQLQAEEVGRWARAIVFTGKDTRITLLSEASTATSFSIPLRIASISRPYIAAWRGAMG
jgi:hypothetical protein